MIRYLTHKEIDKKEWDKALDRSHNRLPYAQSWYLDRVCPNWEALVLNDYKAIMPLTSKKKYGLFYLFPPYFAQQLGIFSEKIIDQAFLQRFLDSIPSKYQFIELNLNTRNTFKVENYKSKPNRNIELDLSRDYEVLKKKYSDDIARNIKKAHKNNVQIKNGIDAGEIIHMFRKNTGKKISNLKTTHYKVLSLLFDDLRKHDQLETTGAFINGKLCAGVVWLKYPGRSVFLFSANNSESRKNGAMHLMIDNFIKQNAGKNMILDFEGSNIDSLARFYKGFGSDEYVYLQIRRNRLPKLVRWIKK